MKTKKKANPIKESTEEKSGHECPYCGKINLQINNHFTHVEFMHPGKSIY